jgi:hypothetical protein
MTTDHTHNRNWPVFFILSLLPLAMITQGSLAFWTGHYAFAGYSTDGQSAEMLGLVATSVGWALLWAFTPLVGAPKRGALAMAALAGLWALLFLSVAHS